MNFCGLEINCHHLNDLLKDTGSCKILVTVNAEAVVRAQKDAKLLKIINSNYASIDGQIPLWLYRWKYKGIDICKLSGSDLIYDVAAWAEKSHKKIFLLGGRQDSNEESVLKLKEKYPALEIAGYSPEYAPYPFSKERNDEILSKVEAFLPDIIFVGFGMGKQEYWSSDNLDYLNRIGVRLLVGSGGTFEFVSGKIKRAPRFVQKCGLEGFWRLFNEMKWFRVKRLLLSFKIFPIYFSHHVMHSPNT